MFSPTLSPIYAHAHIEHPRQHISFTAGQQQSCLHAELFACKRAACEVSHGTS